MTPEVASAGVGYVQCSERFSTYERPVLATPLLIKRDGTREAFSHDKLEAGLRVACAKRPISAADIERIIGEIESELQQLGKAEVSSRLVGDRAIAKLKEWMKSPISVMP